MEVASPQHLGDSFSCGWLKCGTVAQAPSFERLVDADLGGGGGLGHSFGSSRSFIDMDPAELFSLRWTTALPVTDFDFGLPDAGDRPSSRMLVSASQIIRNGYLLPCEPTRRSSVQEQHEDRVTELPSAPRSAASSPRYHPAQSTPTSLSSCSSTRSIAGNKNAKAPAPVLAGRRSSRASSWKILLRYLRFVMPLYRKIRALRQISEPRPRVAPASPARASTSSLEWCHGNADTAVRDAILYCKKSSGQA